MTSVCGSICDALHMQEGKRAAVGRVSVPAPIYHTLSADTISKKMFDIVNEVNVVFQLPMPYVRLLLIACKWDKEKLLERSVPMQIEEAPDIT